MREANVLSSLLVLFLLLAACAWLSASQAPAGRDVVLFEGARLIDGNGRAPIENSAFLVENNTFTRVGRKGELRAPAGATKVDLTGKTVMPALVDPHNHIGYTNQKTGVSSKENFTRATLIDHLQRYAYYGVAAAMSMGLDRWDVNPEMPYELSREIVPNAALFLTVGRGIAATPMAGPTAVYRLGVPYGAMTEAEGIKDVEQLVARKVPIIKIWVDDRNGTVPKIQPNVYRAIIAEAHKRGTRVVAHIFNLVDGKDLLRAGVDGFAHGVRDKDVDDEYIALIKQHPKVWVEPNLPDQALTADEIDWLSETLPASQIKRMRDQLASRPPAELKTQQEAFGIQCRNLKKIHDAGVKIAFATDAGVDVGWTVHTELADMVRCGLTPAEAVVAATRTAAEITKLDRLGTVGAGKSADFIVLEANPLDTITNTRRIGKVYLRGKEVDRAALRASLSAP
jgi:imidazolonepropionase-like amidohydrolase